MRLIRLVLAGVLAGSLAAPAQALRRRSSQGGFSIELPDGYGFISGRGAKLDIAGWSSTSDPRVSGAAWVVSVEDFEKARGAPERLAQELRASQRCGKRACRSLPVTVDAYGDGAAFAHYELADPSIPRECGVFEGVLARGGRFFHVEAVNYDPELGSSRDDIFRIVGSIEPGGASDAFPRGASIARVELGPQQPAGAPGRGAQSRCPGAVGNISLLFSPPPAPAVAAVTAPSAVPRAARPVVVAQALPAAAPVAAAVKPAPPAAAAPRSAPALALTGRNAPRPQTFPKAAAVGPPAPSRAPAAQTFAAAPRPAPTAQLTPRPMMSAQARPAGPPVPSRPSTADAAARLAAPAVRAAPAPALAGRSAARPQGFPKPAFIGPRPAAATSRAQAFTPAQRPAPRPALASRPAMWPQARPPGPPVPSRPPTAGAVARTAAAPSRAAPAPKLAAPAILPARQKLKPLPKPVKRKPVKTRARPKTMAPARRAAPAVAAPLEKLPPSRQSFPRLGPAPGPEELDYRPAAKLEQPEDAAIVDDPVPALIDVLRQKDPRRRALAADVLAQRGDEARPAVQALIAALKDSDARVRSSAALALGDIGGPQARRALGGLRRLLKDRDVDVRLSAQTALQRLGEK